MYVNPTKTIGDINATLRETKVVEEELRDKIRRQYTHEHPASSREKTDGAVFRLTYEHKMKQLQRTNVRL
jgi:hypothetical protein